VEEAHQWYHEGKLVEALDLMPLQSRDRNLENLANHALKRTEELRTGRPVRHHQNTYRIALLPRRKDLAWNTQNTDATGGKQREKV
jgi:hypothetical protein